MTSYFVEIFCSDEDEGYIAMQRGTALIVLLCGGDKRDQAKDIESATQIAQDWLNTKP